MKYSIEDVQKIAEERNGVVLSTSYKNTASKLKFKCNVCDNIWETCFGSIIYHNTWCPYCSQKTRKTTEEVKHAIEKEGYELLSEYVNNCTKMELKCPKGHKYTATWAKFQSGQRCPDCAGSELPPDVRNL
jgi:ketopantoate reductase